MVGLFRSTLIAATPESAERRLRELYGDVRLDGVGDYAERSIGDDRFAVTEVTLGGEFEVAADCSVVTAAFSTPGYRWRAGDDDGDLSEGPALFVPGRPMSSRVEGRPRITTVTFDVDALAAVAGAVYGSPTPLRFEGSNPVTPRAGRVLARAVRMIDDARLLDSDLSRAAAYRALAIATLETFRLYGDRSERAVSAQAGLAAYRRASRFIDDNLALPITVADVAQAAGVSEAALQTSFEVHSALGWTVTEQLRRGRLAAAHLDLVNGDPTAGVTVAAIAARWGFASSSRFAQHYRAVYGVNPKWVLDR